MLPLLETEMFSSVASTISDAAIAIKSNKNTLMLLAAPSIAGVLSIAPIEAAMLDSGLPYRRRFRMAEPSNGSWVHIMGPSMEAGPNFISDPPRLTISGRIVEGLQGSSGDFRRGPLTTVAQAHALAQMISPSGTRVKRLRPWMISGNWMHSALDNTYDPVYTALRDFLHNQSLVRVVPLPEVEEPELSLVPWIDELALDAVRSRWQELDIEGRARAISNLMKPGVFGSNSSTARLEELGWHRIMGLGWKRDLASQVIDAGKLWKQNSAIIASNLLADSLISKGTVPSLKSED
mgnify:FL=1